MRVLPPTGEELLCNKGHHGPVYGCRFTPDGKYVLYSSDLTGYSNMYLVEVGDFEDLPLLTDDVQPQHT